MRLLKHIVSVVLLASVVTLSMPPAADAAGGRGLLGGQARVSLDQAIDAARARYGGRVISAKSRGRGKRRVHIIRILDRRGRVHRFKMRARNGRVVGGRR